MGLPAAPAPIMATDLILPGSTMFSPYNNTTADKVSVKIQDMLPVCTLNSDIDTGHGDGRIRHPEP